MNSLKDYGELFEKLNLTELKVEEGEFKLVLKKEIHNSTRVVEKNVQVAPENDSPAAEKEVKSVSEGTAVKAPLLGIFYLGKKEDKVIEVGDEVSKGDVICNIEAMKMMNEVKATTSGVIKEICAQDGNLVEYGQNLFIIG